MAGVCGPGEAGVSSSETGIEARFLDACAARFIARVESRGRSRRIGTVVKESRGVALWLGTGRGLGEAREGLCRLEMRDMDENKDSRNEGIAKRSGIPA